MSLNSNFVGYKGSTLNLDKLLINNSYFTTINDEICIEKESNIYKVFFENILIRQWEYNDNKIICFFEEPNIIQLTSTEFKELIGELDTGYFYAPYVPMFYKNS